MDLKNSKKLKELPDLSTAIDLRKLNLEGCSSIVKLPSSIGSATNLEKLNLSGCLSLVELPSSIGNATKLEELNLSGCLGLVELPSSIGNATNLQKLYLGGCSGLVKLPSSIGNATTIQELDCSGCSSLVKLPSSIGNLQRLTEFNLKECSKLEVLPTNIHLKSLITLDLTGCSSVKDFPEISTNIKFLTLTGTAIQDVPSSVKRWTRLEKLRMSYSENLRGSLDRITELHLTDTRIQELSPWVADMSSLRRLVLNEMENLVTVSDLPYSLDVLNAENCVSLERLDCSFSNPDIRLNFRNCCKLNQEARDRIIQTSTSVLPGEEVPACFTYRASGSSVTVNLNEQPLCTSIKFKACILLVEDIYYAVAGSLSVECRITSKENALTSCIWNRHRLYPFKEHLYIYEIVADEVASTELVFEFQLKNYPARIAWKIKECGIVQLLDSGSFVEEI